MRALVIEDNYQIARIERNALRSAGFAVDIVPSGAEASRLLADPRAAIDVVVIDRCLLDMSGDVAVAETRARRPDAAVIITTGLAGAAPDCDAFLLKPFRMSDFADAVASALARRRLRKTDVSATVRG